MPLFQTSVLKNHLALLNDSEVDKAYKKYQNYFWNTTIQENIKTAKEEQYQATFLHELFVNILGYTLFPNPDSNLTTEFKNEKNQRKADGAILKNGVAIGVIELKGTNTKDLESIRRQAFDYKANHKGCIYVITSNFEKLRFYINDATEFEEFDLFLLSKERFRLMYLCLHLNKIVNNTPLKIKEASIAEEQEITKTFYKDYSLFKRELYRDLVRNNSKTVRDKLDALDDIDYQNDLTRLEKNVKLTLFQKSQKLIDRFLFIFFAEDRMLLPSNSTLQILNKWKDDNDFGDERPLYDLFKQYFHFLDTGRKGTQSRAEIYAYNGGLFKPDAILDALEIDNDLLYKYTSLLSNYDFESQIDVNILGHIFENSLNEIESVNAEIEGADFDKQTSKRKKDGVFYTPKYITKYIVENTVGKLCEEKKIELDFHEEEYFKGRKNRNKTTIEKLVNILDDYREWLLQLTICDPACGSGAFLNQALDFLIKEHTYIDELKTKLLGGGLQFPDIENTILENNIYGVDLNEESVEIAKLSLWLRTAQPRRKLNDLSSNIKCGNSLIDDKKVAGDKAFKWELEFKHIFEKGGFDVVIGNPPYALITNSKLKDYFEENYKTVEGRIDLFELFIEKSTGLLRYNAEFAFIIPNTLLSNLYSRKLRLYILQKFAICEIVNFGMDVFADPTVHTCIIQLKNKTINQNLIGIKKQVNEAIDINNKIDYFLKQEEFLTKENFTLDIFFNPEEKKIIDKMESFTPLKEVCFIRQCIKTGDDKTYVQLSEEKPNEPWKKCLNGKGIGRYQILENNLYLKYGDWLARNWKNKTFYEVDKIVIRETGSRITATLDMDNNYLLSSLYSVYPKESKSIDFLKALLGVINSKLSTYYIKKIAFELTKGAFTKVRTNQLGRLPIPHLDDHQINSFSSKTSIILNINTEYVKYSVKFQNYLLQKFQIIKLSRKLENWNELSFGDFIKELNKAIKSTNKERAKENLELLKELTKKDEFEWMELFEENKKKAQELQNQINRTEKEIDQMVYELYGLTEEEIAIVEGS